jgi:hypothetical protein
MAKDIIAATGDDAVSSQLQVVSDARDALTVWIDAATQGCDLDKDTANTLQFTISRIASSIDDAALELKGVEDEDVYRAKQFLLLIDRALWNFSSGEIKSPRSLSPLVRTAQIADLHLSRIATALAGAIEGTR